jgi:hypothetical protein
VTGYLEALLELARKKPWSTVVKGLETLTG